MAKLFKTLLLVLIIVFVSRLPALSVSAQSPSPLPTPTYDPFAQPPLPDNPTELVLGRYLYWRHCMPCHGDKGQGLTDEFRAAWDPEHQNCWTRGCHSGRYADDNFPIPTAVPSLIGDNHLMSFSSVQALADYLKATHPPQNPGLLDDAQYHAIASLLSDINGRPLAEVISEPAFTPTVGLAFQEQVCPSDLLLILAAVFGIMAIAISRTSRKAGLR